MVLTLQLFFLRPSLIRFAHNNFGSEAKKAKQLAFPYASQMAEAIS